VPAIDILDLIRWGPAAMRPCATSQLQQVVQCGTEGERADGGGEHRRLMAEFWSWRLRQVPEFASSVGVHDFDDRLETFTLEAFRKRKVLVPVCLLT